MPALSRPSRRRPAKRTALWFERILAFIGLVNLILVLFDTSYIRFRDIYLQFIPEVTVWYGETLKGIEPERSTVAYLETVEKLKEQVAQTGLTSIQAETLLADLREKSQALIDENPFQIANKSGTLERIKNQMRDRTGTDSSKRAFATFWSVGYLTQEGWSQEISYFNEDIIPLMETNYFRRIGEDGGPLDLFVLLDGWFVALFGLELLARTFYISRRYQNANWLDALLLRWYDLFFFLPFWRWLRAIPVLIRLNQSQLVNLIPLRNRINRVFITNFAVELTEVVVLRIIDQIQNLIRDGNVTQWLLATGSGRRYVDLNGIDEVQAISTQVSTLLIYRILPKIKPELDAVLHHTLTNAFNEAPGYKSFRQIPGLGALPDQIAQQVVSQASATLYSTLTGSLADQKGGELTQTLMEQFGDSLRAELQTGKTLEELQALIIDLLDEVKINYVQQLDAEDVEQLMEENYRIYNITQQKQ
ncbi:MAG: hypothetical protein O3A14_12255 [Cyanobacteria bacterium]|nr:hypothetical protein [Cyanobacteriota bacterium]